MTNYRAGLGSVTSLLPKSAYNEENYNIKYYSNLRKILN